MTNKKLLNDKINAFLVLIVYILALYNSKGYFKWEMLF
ncbi:putative membrane protein [Wolbachia pipientis wVitA]|nr:putative membrane protein [Wolbachia pipientis wVitA]